MRDTSTYVSVYKPIAGWKPIIYWWNNEDPTMAFWEPWDTYFMAFATEGEAITAAKSWAKDKGLPFSLKHKPEPVPTKAEIMSILEARYPNA